MGLVIAGPGSEDPGFLQEQIDDLREDVVDLEQEPRGFPTHVTSPSDLVQVLHRETWTPAGVLCIDTLDQIVEPAQILHPQPGVTEISFGFSFTGKIYLS